MTPKPIIRAKRTKKAKGVAAKPPKVVMHAHQERLLRNIKARLSELEKLLDRASEYLADPKDAHLVGNPFSSIHRRWRRLIRKAYSALQDLMPDRPITDPFRTMVAQATERDYDLSAKAIEARGSRLSEALSYGFFYLAVACNTARQPEGQPDEADEGWEAFLKIFDLNQPS